MGDIEQLGFVVVGHEFMGGDPGIDITLQGIAVLLRINRFVQEDIVRVFLFLYHMHTNTHCRPLISHFSVIATCFARVALCLTK